MLTVDCWGSLGNLAREENYSPTWEQDCSSVVSDFAPNHRRRNRKENRRFSQMWPSDMEEEKTEVPNKYRYSSLVRQDQECWVFDPPFNLEPAGHHPGLRQQTRAGSVQHGGHPELHPQHQHRQHSTTTVSQIEYEWITFELTYRQETATRREK